MTAKQSRQLEEANRFEPHGTRQPGHPVGLERQTQGDIHRTNHSLLQLVNPLKPRILIVSDNDSISQELETILGHAGLSPERAPSMKAGCELARSGRFQVVVTVPELFDGSWKRLAAIANNYRPSFVIILAATTFDLRQWTQALEDGAFDVLDALYELPRVAEAARRALWAAHLKGVGPRPEAPRSPRLA